jgi:hypothetical protein
MFAGRRCEKPRSLGRRNFSAQIAEKPVSFGDTFCVHSYGYELEGITKRSSPFDNLSSKISTAQTPSPRIDCVDSYKFNSNQVL